MPAWLPACLALNIYLWPLIFKTKNEWDKSGECFYVTICEPIEIILLVNCFIIAFQIELLVCAQNIEVLKSLNS